jgi:hypothetical protein
LFIFSSQSSAIAAPPLNFRKAVEKEGFYRKKAGNGRYLNPTGGVFC